MPLITGKSDKSFSQNVRTEMDAGKPQKQSLAIAYAMKKKAEEKKMAGGGMCSAHGAKDCGTCMAEGGFIEEEKQTGYEPMPEEHPKYDEMAMEEDDRDLNQHGEDEQGPYGMNMAEGGQITDNYQPTEDEMDMVGRVMKKMQEHYSEGGMVANDTPIRAGFEENDFDDLAKHDDLESSYTGADSGDEIGDEREDHDRDDIISRVKRSLAKKDRMPRPA